MPDGQREPSGYLVCNEMFTANYIRAFGALMCGVDKKRPESLIWFCFFPHFHYSDLLIIFYYAYM